MAGVFTQDINKVRRVASEFDSLHVWHELCEPDHFERTFRRE